MTLEYSTKKTTFNSKAIQHYPSKTSMYLNSKISKDYWLKVSLANSNAVYGLKVEPSRQALAQSSFPWQVQIVMMIFLPMMTKKSQWWLLILAKPSGVQWSSSVGAIFHREPNWPSLPILPHGYDHEQVHRMMMMMRRKKMMTMMNIRMIFIITMTLSTSSLDNEFGEDLTWGSAWTMWWW